MKILFVRHGKSLANANLTIGTPVTPLAEEGLEQARKTGMNLRSHGVTIIVCSDFIRAQQTAELIAAELGIPVQQIITIPELGERRFGDLEGKQKNNESAYFYKNDTEHGFESRTALIGRVTTALSKVKEIAQQTEGSVVVVGHAVSGFYLLQVAKGFDAFEKFESFVQMGNAEFIEVPSNG